MAPQVKDVSQLIQPGDMLPEAIVEVSADGRQMKLADVMGGSSGMSLLVGMPGAFTPTCSTCHLPSLVEAAPRLEKARPPRLLDLVHSSRRPTLIPASRDTAHSRGSVRTRPSLGCTADRRPPCAAARAEDHRRDHVERPLRQRGLEEVDRGQDAGAHPPAPLPLPSPPPPPLPPPPPPGASGCTLASSLDRTPVS